MPMSEIEQRFFKALKRSYGQYLEKGGRSTAKLKPLHGWVQDEIQRGLNDPKYIVIGHSESSGSEVKIDGKYYRKNVDVVISKNGINVGVVSVKFPLQSYRKNKINMFENQLGETANLRMNNLVFGHLCVFPVPLPDISKKKIKKLEVIKDDIIGLYAALASDSGSKHAPDVQSVALAKIFFKEAFDWKDHIASGAKIKHASVNVEKVEPAERSDVELSDRNWDKLQGLLSIDRFIEMMCAKIKLKYKDLKAMNG